MFRSDIAKLRNALIRHMDTCKAASSVATNNQELKKVLRELLPLLKRHDVKKIRKYMETVTGIINGAPDNKGLRKLESLVNVYQYEEAMELISKILEEDGSKICLN